MKVEQYFVKENGGEVISGPHYWLSEAVLASVRYDGWGALYTRLDEDGFLDSTQPMRLFVSPKHIGNNPYVPDFKDWFCGVEAYDADDDTAKAKLAVKLITNGNLHRRYEMIVEEVTKEYGVVTYVDGVSVESLASELECSALEIRNQYA